MNITKGFPDQYSECQSHAPRVISSHDGLQTHYSWHCASNPLLPTGSNGFQRPDDVKSSQRTPVRQR